MNKFSLFFNMVNFAVMVRNRFWLMMMVVTLFGAVIRLVNLDRVPPSLFADEVDAAYQAYSIVQTGRDYFGNSFPITFHSFQDWRAPLFIYALVPSVAILGISEYAVRLPTAIFGILSIPLMGCLMNLLFKNKTVAVLGTLMLAVSPWHIHYSRAGFEASMLLFLLLAGVVLVIHGLGKRFLLYFGLVLLGLTPFVYSTSKLFTPLFLVLLAWAFWPKINLSRPKLVKLVAACGFFVAIIAGITFFGQGGSRFSILAIFTDPTIPAEINVARFIDFVQAQMLRSSAIFHNVFWSVGQALSVNYLRPFSPEFLFLFGDPNIRHSLGKMGALFIFDAPLVLFGLWRLLHLGDLAVKRLVIGWLVLSPLPAALTRDGGTHATRLILMLLPLVIIQAYGLWSLAGYFSKKLTYAIYFLVLTVGFSLYLHRYYVHYPLDSERLWHYGFKQAVEASAKSGFGQIIFSSPKEPAPIFYLWWAGFDPSSFQQQGLSPFIIADKFPAQKLANVLFGTINPDVKKGQTLADYLDQNTLYIASHDEIGSNLVQEPQKTPVGLKLVRAIAYPSGEPVFYLFTRETAIDWSKKP